MASYIISMEKSAQGSESALVKALHESVEIQRLPVPKAAPWLVFPHGKGRIFQSFYNPYEPNSRNCIKSIPEMRGKAYYHKPSHQGWLVVIGNVQDEAEYSVANSNLGDCFLWNPISSETIRLPILDRWSFRLQKYFLFDLVLSSPPPTPSISSKTNDPENLSCLVYLLFKCVKHREAPEHVLIFCRPGDKQWRMKVLSITAPGRGHVLSIDSLLCFKGELYAFCKESHFKDNWLIKIDVQNLWHHVVDNKQTQYTTIINVGYADYTRIGAGEEYSRYTEHWIESDSGIFRVHLNCSPRGFRKVSSIHIFKLDFSSMTWVLLKTLDDHVLFMSSSMDVSDSRKCYSTSTAYCSAASMGLERGCLFYTLLGDQTLYTFEIEDSSTTVIMPCLELPTPWFRPTWIPMPTTENRHVAGRRRKTDVLASQDTSDARLEEENMDRLKKNGGELEELKLWDFLNDYDSTEEVARYLHPVDYVHFRLACKQISVLPPLNRKLASTRTTTTTVLSPWLISIFEDNEENICNVIDPMHNNDRYVMKLSDELLIGATIRFSKDGWLLLSKGKKTVFCYNPFTRAIIRLPELPDGYVLGGMSFSSIPTSHDCVVFVISNWYEICGDNGISFCVVEPGKGETGWTIQDFDYGDYTEDDNFMPCINNPVFYNGAFYCLDYNGMLGVFSMKDNISWKLLSKSLKQFSGFFPSYLVQCDGKLLLVNLGQSGKLVEIYRLDDSQMIWVKLNSLGKHALFISYTSSFSVVAPRSCMENNIYFPRLQGERILYYSLDTGSYHYVGSKRNQYSAQDFHNTKERSNCTWIEPRWS